MTVPTTYDTTLPSHLMQFTLYRCYTTEDHLLYVGLAVRDQDTPTVDKLKRRRWGKLIYRIDRTYIKGRAYARFLRNEAVTKERPLHV